MKMTGKFHILFFIGDLQYTRDKLGRLRQQVDAHFPRFAHAVALRTIILNSGVAFEEHLGVEPFGDAYWDPTHLAHLAYRVAFESGAIIVVRPDGIVGHISDLSRYEMVEKYFEKIIVPQGIKDTRAKTNGVHGDLISPDENNLYGKPLERVLPVSVEKGIII